MKNNILIKLLLISFLFLVFVTFNSCKRYKPVVIRGRLLNVSINKGVAGEPVQLNSYPSGKNTLPSKAEVELITNTDGDGYFEFAFEAFKPYNKERSPEYGIEVIKSLSKKRYCMYIDPYEGSEPTFDLYKYYNDNLLPLVHVTDEETKNDIIINVVTAAKLNIYCYNQQLPANDTDYVTLKYTNQYGTFTYGRFFGKLNGLTSAGYEPAVTTGQTTFKAIIQKKNGFYEERDTTFFVEDKEYNLVYRY